MESGASDMVMVCSLYVCAVNMGVDRQGDAVGFDNLLP